METGGCSNSGIRQSGRAALYSVESGLLRLQMPLTKLECRLICFAMLSLLETANRRQNDCVAAMADGGSVGCRTSDRCERLSHLWSVLEIS